VSERSSDPLDGESDRGDTESHMGGQRSDPKAYELDDDGSPFGRQIGEIVGEQHLAHGADDRRRRCAHDSTKATPPLLGHGLTSCM
jgi:hypothetical protein